MNRFHKNCILLFRCFPYIFFLLFFTYPVSGQYGIKLGYAGAITSLKETNRLIYVYNLKPGFDMPMGYVRNMHGLSVTFYGLIDDDIRWEIRWQNRHKIVSSERTISEDVWRREIKMK